MNLPPNLAKLKEEIKGYALSYGLDPFDTIFEVLDFKEINQIASYGGFPTRYPHWSFGMEYEHMKKSYAYGFSKIYEMVINNDPCYAYLLESNDIVDQKLVIAHVYGHSDFFKNNYWFSKTNRKMMDEMANHSTRIRKYFEKYGRETVEHFMDIVMAIDNLIDYHLPFITRKREEEGVLETSEIIFKTEIQKFKSKDYMDAFINPKEYLEEQKKILEQKAKAKKKFPEKPEKDVLQFLLENAALRRWQRDVLSIIREESYYFAPQGQTKIMNEGWACLKKGSFINTDIGLQKIEDIVEKRLSVKINDGENYRRVYDWAKFKNRKTVWIRTKRGYEVEGSVTHRLLLHDKNWCCLNKIRVGDSVAMSGGNNLWPKEYKKINWQTEKKITLEDIAKQVKVSIGTVLRYRDGVRGRYAGQLEPYVAQYDTELATLSYMQNSRNPVNIPEIVDERFSEFLGYLIGDGHISEKKRVIGFTTGDKDKVGCFVKLVKDLFNVSVYKKWDEGRWRVYFHSRDIEDFLKHLGLKTGRCARNKKVPDVILGSPKKVVAAFLRAYFDCDGYAGKQGVILSTASEALSKTVQLLLLNFNILSSRRSQKDGCWHVHIAGKSTIIFENVIGFGLRRKQKLLRKYINSHKLFKVEKWNDKIIAIENRRSDVYDISVSVTHRYAAQGFINHNSFWHSRIMTEKALTDKEVIDYADHHSSTLVTRPGMLNPYKLGVELFRDIVDRWNKGKFGKEYEESENIDEKKSWDKKLGKGMKKIFEVRKHYNDVSFIDEFLTPEFVQQQKMFTYDYNEKTNMYVISDRDFKKIKQKLLFSLTNFGQPRICVTDANFANKTELYLTHAHEGVDLRMDYANEVLSFIYEIWQRPVNLETVYEGRKMLFCFDGKEHKESVLS